MNKTSWAKRALAVGLAAVCVAGFAGCSSTQEDSVAATVNGAEIAESKVTSVIENVRTQQSLTDEETWGQWMSDNGYTPESLREEVLEGFIQQEVLLQNAESRGVTVESSEIDSYVDQMKSNYSSDAAWQSALSSVGMTEDDYRDNIKLNLVMQGVLETFDATASDEDLLSYAQMYASSYDGAKKSSHILFDADDEATAQQVLDQINAGTLDFAQAAEQYSKDTGSAADGGNVGWDKLTSFVTEYTDALDQLDEGQVSGLVTSSYGIHIIKCTQVFHAPEEVTSLDQLPSEFVDAIRSTADSSAKQDAYQAWLDECRNNSDVVINDMPSDVSYNVDMSSYETAEDDASSSDEAVTDATVEAEVADDTSTDTAAAEESSSDENVADEASAEEATVDGGSADTADQQQAA